MPSQKSKCSKCLGRHLPPTGKKCAGPHLGVDKFTPPNPIQVLASLLSYFSLNLLVTVQCPYNPSPNFVIQTSAASGVTLKTADILPSCQKTGLWFYNSFYTLFLI